MGTGTAYTLPGAVTLGTSPASHWRVTLCTAGTLARPKWLELTGCIRQSVSHRRRQIPRFVTYVPVNAVSLRPFDAILVDDTSRMSRDLADSLEIVKQMKFAGVRVVFVSQGFDTNAPQTQTLVTVHGLVDSLYLEELAKKTFRGVEQRAIHGLHTGGRVFGYRRVPIESQTEHDSHGRSVIQGVTLEVDQEQAATVRRIFQRYANGDSLKRIAISLNSEQVASPQPQRGRVSQSWCPSSVRHILLNERYRGLMIWGRTFKVRSPETGRRIYRGKPESEWVKREIPAQRIVSDQLWDSVQERFHDIRAMNGARIKSGRALASPYLFTGLLECSECHGNITIVSGTRKGRPYRRVRLFDACPSREHRLHEWAAGLPSGS